VNNKSLAFKVTPVMIEVSHMPEPKKRILVVDDEPFVCDAVKMMLTFDGHDVVTANDAKEALEVFEKGSFDLVITDFAMPGMKGDELAAAIKSRSPEQPVVMITAYAEMLQSSGKRLPGVDFLVSKPFLLEHLREAIATVLPNDHPRQGAPSESKKG
jgi:CheY-like chemotaxis protein